MHELIFSSIDAGDVVVDVDVDVVGVEEARSCRLMTVCFARAEMQAPRANKLLLMLLPSRFRRSSDALRSVIADDSVDDAAELEDEEGNEEFVLVRSLPAKSTKVNFAVVVSAAESCC